MHEQSLNLAFGEGTALRLLCPYATGLEPSALDEARHAHPFACDHDGPLAGDECDHVWARPAPPPAEPAHVDLVFRGTTVRFHVSLD